MIADPGGCSGNDVVGSQQELQAQLYRYAEEMHHLLSEHDAHQHRFRALENSTRSVSEYRDLLLVAEDNEINQEILVSNLLDDGASVVAVCNGRAAVDRIIADGGQAYDIVLMDIQMPEMNGHRRPGKFYDWTPACLLLARQPMPLRKKSTRVSRPAWLAILESRSIHRSLLQRCWSLPEGHRR